MTPTIAGDCDGDVSAADIERPKVGRVSLHAEGCEREGHAESGPIEICAEQKMFLRRISTFCHVISTAVNSKSR